MESESKHISSFLMLLFFILSYSYAGSGKPIYKCTVITEPGNYKLVRDLEIQDKVMDACIYIVLVDNVTVDFNKHSIIGGKKSGIPAVLVHSSSNVHLKNGVFKYTSIEFDYSENSDFEASILHSSRVFFRNGFSISASKNRFFDSYIFAHNTPSLKIKDSHFTFVKPNKHRLVFLNLYSFYFSDNTIHSKKKVSILVKGGGYATISSNRFDSYGSILFDHVESPDFRENSIKQRFDVKIKDSDSAVFEDNTVDFSVYSFMFENDYIENNHPLLEIGNSDAIVSSSSFKPKIFGKNSNFYKFSINVSNSSVKLFGTELSSVEPYCDYSTLTVKGSTILGTGVYSSNCDLSMDDVYVDNYDYSTSLNYNLFVSETLKSDKISLNKVNFNGIMLSTEFFMPKGNTVIFKGTSFFKKMNGEDGDDQVLFPFHNTTLALWVKILEGKYFGFPLTFYPYGIYYKLAGKYSLSTYKLLPYFRIVYRNLDVTPYEDDIFKVDVDGSVDVNSYPMYKITGDVILDSDSTQLIPTLDCVDAAYDFFNDNDALSKLNSFLPDSFSLGKLANEICHSGSSGLNGGGGNGGSSDDGLITPGDITADSGDGNNGDWTINSDGFPSNGDNTSSGTDGGSGVKEGGGSVEPDSLIDSSECYDSDMLEKDQNVKKGYVEYSMTIMGVEYSGKKYDECQDSETLIEMICVDGKPDKMEVSISNTDKYLCMDGKIINVG